MSGKTSGSTGHSHGRVGKGGPRPNKYTPKPGPRSRAPTRTAPPLPPRQPDGRDRTAAANNAKAGPGRLPGEYRGNNGRWRKPGFDFAPGGAR